MTTKGDVVEKLEKPLVENRKITTAKKITHFDENMIQSEMNTMYKKIATRYKIEEEQVYNALYLRVRKAFLAEER